MGTLYLVRHGQASFGADDYDQLSALGQRQSQRLGQYFKARDLQFEAALTGTLKRQEQTLAAICEGLDAAPLALAWPGLNEYDSLAVIATVHPQPLPKPTNPEMVRHHFRLLRDGLAQWMAGTVSPAGMPSYRDFAQGVADVLAHVRKTHAGDVLLVSSGGPIATAVAQVLGASPEASIALNLRIRNSSVTEFDFNLKRHALVSYNALPHLHLPADADWVTYA
jgi:broad specificity phosphatase PhoE